MKHAARTTIVFLFLLSLLTWIHIEHLLAWELSIVTTQLGVWFALATLLALIPFQPWTLARPPFRPSDVGFIALGLVAIGTYLAPVFSTVIDHPGSLNVVKLLSPSESATPMKRLTFTAGNGSTPLNLDFYPPTSTASKPVPWVLVIHGGGWINGSSDQLPELNYHLARKGYGIISIDYRLSPGWLWPAPKDDTMAALQFIRHHASEWNLDANRWVLLGRSAGAQIAGVVAYSLHGNDRPRGYISFYNPTDLVFGYEVGQEEDILRSRTLLRGFLGGTPDQAKALYKSASVMESVTPDACPTLLIHGLRDTLVWSKHTTRLEEVLMRNKIDTKVVLFRFGPHGFDFFFHGPEAQASTMEVDQFLARVLPL
jgi:acetyl esterase/lipase